MNDTNTVDNSTPGSELTAGNSQAEKSRGFRDFLKNFKAKVEGKIHRSPSPFQTKTASSVPSSIESQENKQTIEKVARVEIPIPGAAPIPEGNIRLFHFLYPKNLESIRRQGLVSPDKKAHGYNSDLGLNTSPNSTWVYSELNLNEPPGWTIGKPYLEFSVPPSDMGPHNAVAKEGTARTLKPGVDIPPDKIIAIHEPWHEMVRHSNNGVINAEWLKKYIDRSVQVVGEHNTHGNYTDYSAMAKQKEYLESQVMEANKYLNYP